MPAPTRFPICLFLALSAGVFAQETSVNPGINASYLSEDMVVASWVERLEREGREVADNRDAIVARIGIKPGMEIADIGTGTGLFLPTLSAAVGEQGKVYAVDIIEKFLAHVHTHIERRGWKNVETVLCTERSAELAPNSVDLAFICNVYHHFEYPADTLASLHRALRPGGRIVLVDFKRIPGTSADWILNHMRAGQEVFEAEITQAGFNKTDEITDLLSDNYFVIFEKSS
ncbi:MAG: methyltransferase domain-containing protein [Opitutaceae bacterium]|jgi:ubiquinone/menaquinone biosynthesis C-methylase UbiE|nr:methyltransferase domain-containing protein [Opitutaceae bacterium]